MARLGRFRAKRLNSYTNDGALGNRRLPHGPNRAGKNLKNTGASRVALAKSHRRRYGDSPRSDSAGVAIDVANSAISPQTPASALGSENPGFAQIRGQHAAPVGRMKMPPPRGGRIITISFI